MSHLLERTCFHSKIYALSSRARGPIKYSLGKLTHEDMISTQDRQSGGCCHLSIVSLEPSLPPVSLKCVMETDLLKIAFGNSSSISGSTPKTEYFVNCWIWLSWDIL